MSTFVDGERSRFGVEPICQTLDVSASAYYERRSGRRSVRAVADERLLGGIRELQAANYYAYGYRRTWKALRRAGEQVPRCRVQRLMRDNGIQGAKRRGKPWRTTRPDPLAQRRPDLVQRDFSASRPNELWVADLSYLRCWEGLVYFAFVIDAYSRTADRRNLLVPRNSKRWGELYRGRGAVERAFGRLKNEYGLAPLRLRGRQRVALHADLCILAVLAQALARARPVPLAA